MRSRRVPLAATGIVVVASGFGGCAQNPQQIAASHGKEYFPSSVYGAASRRVIADGQPVPRGGGKYLVGKPYTVAGQTYYPTESRATQVGFASWYGDAFHGRLTANGEIYDRDGFTAASPTMPIPSYVRVTNLRNDYSMVVRVNDRGPYASNRIMDVSRRVAESLDFKRYGTTKLKVVYLGPASLAGSDDTRLMATLHTGREEPTSEAAAIERPRIVAAIEPAPEPRQRRVQRPVVSVAVADPVPLRPRRPLDGAREREIARADPLPPARPMDLGTIPGAETPIRARPLRLHLARTHDDD